MVFWRIVRAFMIFSVCLYHSCRWLPKDLLRYALHTQVFNSVVSAWALEEEPILLIGNIRCLHKWLLSCFIGQRLNCEYCSNRRRMKIRIRNVGDGGRLQVLPVWCLECGSGQSGVEVVAAGSNSHVQPWPSPILSSSSSKPDIPLCVLWSFSQQGLPVR